MPMPPPSYQQIVPQGTAAPLAHVFVPGASPLQIQQQQSIAPVHIQQQQYIAQAQLAPALPHGWQTATDPQGRTYYIDHATQQTHWTLPGGPLPSHVDPLPYSNPPASALFSPQHQATPNFIAPEILGRFLFCFGATGYSQVHISDLLSSSDLDLHNVHKSLVPVAAAEAASAPAIACTIVTHSDRPMGCNSAIVCKEMPQPLASQYNVDYICCIERVSTDGKFVKVAFNARGNGSLGPLQDPSRSQLVFEAKNGQSELLMFSEDSSKYRISPISTHGILVYELPPKKVFVKP
jgi:hypothetical protein